MYSFRISKFDPTQAAEDRRNEWTAISDVGRSFGGKRLTKIEYQAVEKYYLAAVRLMLSSAGVTTMVVSEVVRSSIASPASEWVKDGMTVRVLQILRICKHELRGELSCHLQSDDGFCLDVGFDLYVYVTTPVPSSEAIQRIVQMGLYVEGGIPSPYFTD